MQGESGRWVTRGNGHHKGSNTRAELHRATSSGATLHLPRMHCLSLNGISEAKS